MGDLFCAEKCGCTFLDDEETKKETVRRILVETIQGELDDVCHYNTDDCKRYLANMVACGDELPGSEELDSYVLDYLTTEGRLMVLDAAKLGDPALHRFDTQNTRVEEELVSCSEELFPERVMSSARGGLAGLKTACL